VNSPLKLPELIRTKAFGPQALRLLPVSIAKPWGRELWYTAVEERGISRADCAGVPVDLPRLFSRQGQWGIGDARQLLLLKALVANAGAERGQLYLELHQHKWEAYLVTHLDPRAWPEGVATMRLGTNSQLLTAYGCERRFRRDLAAALHDCESLRAKAHSGEGTAAAVSDEEQAARAHLAQFWGYRQIRVGDSVLIPPRIPHGLPHGVRVLEVQTPHYERLVLCFNQRMQTQTAWDIEEGLALMDLADPPPPGATPLPSPSGCRIEELLETPFFVLRRLTLEPGRRLELPLTRLYGLLCVVAGQGSAGSAQLRCGENWLLPAYRGELLLENQGWEPWVLLLTEPNAAVS